MSIDLFRYLVLKSFVRSSVIDSSSTFWYSKALSMKIDDWSMSITNWLKFSLVKDSPVVLLKTSITPRGFPQLLNGTHMIDFILCLRFKALSIFREKRLSWETSGTRTGIPPFATQPAIPSPIIDLDFCVSLVFLPSVLSNTSSPVPSSTRKTVHVSAPVNFFALFMIVSRIVFKSVEDEKFLLDSSWGVPSIDLLLSYRIFLSLSDRLTR